MSAWYLLWMFFDVVALFATCVAIPFLLSWALDSDHRARGGQLDWRIERLRRRNLERYGENFRPCLYCGIECSFGPDCANRDLSPAARARRNQERLYAEMPHLRDRAAEAMASLAPQKNPFPQLPCPCARCGMSATLFRAFQNPAGHVFCSESCYRAGGES